MKATESLDQLREVVRPYVLDAVRTRPTRGIGSVRIHLSPLELEIALTDADGVVSIYHGKVTPELCEACADALPGFVGAMPADALANLGVILARRPGALWLLCDADVRWVRVLLDTGGDADMVELGRLAVLEVLN